MVGTDTFSLWNKTLLCIVEYCSNFPVVKKAYGFLHDDLLRMARIVFTDCGCPNEIVSDAWMCFMPDKFK